jgi:hypothetical protein
MSNQGKFYDRFDAVASRCQDEPSGLLHAADWALVSLVLPKEGA